MKLSEDCVSRKKAIECLRANFECQVVSDIDFSKYLEEIQTLCNAIYEAQKKAIESLPPVTPTFPKGATNGDMIKALYPTAEITDHFELGTPIGNIIYIRLDKYQEMRVQQDWWNAPYKRGDDCL